MKLLLLIISIWIPITKPQEIYNYQKISTITYHTEIVSSLTQLPDGTLGSGSFDKTFQITNLQSISRIGRYTGYSFITSVTALQDGQIAIGGLDQKLKILNTKTNNVQTILSGPDYYGSNILQLQDGRIAVGTINQKIIIWNLKTNSLDLTMTGHTNTITSIIQMQDGTLVSSSFDNTIKLWSLKSTTALATLTGHTDAVSSLLLLRDGRIASSSYDKTIKIWNVQKRSNEATLKDHTDKVTSIIQLSDGRLVSGSYDKTIKLWNLATYSVEISLFGHSDAVNFLLILKDGKFASASSDTTIVIWRQARCSTSLSNCRQQTFNVDTSRCVCIQCQSNYQNQDGVCVSQSSVNTGLGTSSGTGGSTISTGGNYSTNYSPGSPNSTWLFGGIGSISGSSSNNSNTGTSTGSSGIGSSGTNTLISAGSFSGGSSGTSTGSFGGGSSGTNTGSYGGSSGTSSGSYGGGSSGTNAGSYGGSSGTNTGTGAGSYSGGSSGTSSGSYGGGSSGTNTGSYGGGSSGTSAGSYGGSSETNTGSYGGGSSGTNTGSYGGSSGTNTESYGGGSSGTNTGTSTGSYGQIDVNPSLLYTDSRCTNRIINNCDNKELYYENIFDTCLCSQCQNGFMNTLFRCVNKDSTNVTDVCDIPYKQTNETVQFECMKNLLRITPYAEKNCTVLDKYNTDQDIFQPNKYFVFRHRNSTNYIYLGWRTYLDFSKYVLCKDSGKLDSTFVLFNPSCEKKNIPGFYTFSTLTDLKENKGYIKSFLGDYAEFLAQSCSSTISFKNSESMRTVCKNSHNMNIRFDSNVCAKLEFSPSYERVRQDFSFVSCKETNCYRCSQPYFYNEEGDDCFYSPLEYLYLRDQCRLGFTILSGLLLPVLLFLIGRHLYLRIFKKTDDEKSLYFSNMIISILDYLLSIAFFLTTLYYPIHLLILNVFFIAMPFFLYIIMGIKIIHDNPKRTPQQYDLRLMFPVIFFIANSFNFFGSPNNFLKESDFIQKVSTLNLSDPQKRKEFRIYLKKMDLIFFVAGQGISKIIVASISNYWHGFQILSLCGSLIHIGICLYTIYCLKKPKNNEVNNDKNTIIGNIPENMEGIRVSIKANVNDKQIIDENNENNENNQILKREENQAIIV